MDLMKATDQMAIDVDFLNKVRALQVFHEILGIEDPFAQPVVKSDSEQPTPNKSPEAEDAEMNIVSDEDIQQNAKNNAEQQE